MAKKGKAVDEKWVVGLTTGGMTYIFSVLPNGITGAERGSFVDPATAAMVVNAHNAALKPLQTMIRVSFGSKADADMVQERLTTHDRGRILADAAKAM